MSQNRLQGFTLIELIVSVGLFSVVIVVAMSAYLSLVSLDRKARATNDVMTNLSFAVEAMSRSMRTGKNYDCNGYGGGGVSDCTGGISFSFIDENGKTPTYVRKLDCGNGTACIAECNDGICTPGGATPITDPRINVTALTFFTRGAAPGDGIQPNVIFTVTGSVTPDPNSSPISFTIEGSATQRLIDL